MTDEKPRRKPNLTYEEETQIAWGILVLPSAFLRVFFLGVRATKGMQGAAPKELIALMILAPALFAAYLAGRVWLWWRRRNAPD